MVTRQRKSEKESEVERQRELPAESLVVIRDCPKDEAPAAAASEQFCWLLIGGGATQVPSFSRYDALQEQDEPPRVLLAGQAFAVWSVVRRGVLLSVVLVVV